MTNPTALDERKLQELEEKFDPEMRFRPVVPPATWIVMALLIVLSCFHYYTAGFGLLRETTHRGVHLAFVLGLIFLVFPRTRRAYGQPPVSSWHAPGGVPLPRGHARAKAHPKRWIAWRQHAGYLNRFPTAQNRAMRWITQHMASAPIA